MTARFVRTQKEMEGRYEDVWALVDEADDVQSWAPDDELTVVGKPAPRLDGTLRAAGRARYTVDVRLPGMLHAAVLRSPVAHGRVRSLDLDAALAVPGVRAVIGPESELSLTTRRSARSRPSPAMPASRSPSLRPTRSEAAAAGVAALALDIEVLAAHCRPAGGSQRAALHRRAGRRLAWRRGGGSRRRRGQGRVSISTPAQLQTRSSLTPQSPRGTATS